MCVYRFVNNQSNARPDLDCLPSPISLWIFLFSLFFIFFVYDKKKRWTGSHLILILHEHVYRLFVFTDNMLFQCISYTEGILKRTIIIIISSFIVFALFRVNSFSAKFCQLIGVTERSNIPCSHFDPFYMFTFVFYRAV